MKNTFKNIDDCRHQVEPDGSLVDLKAELVGEVQIFFGGGLSNSESQRMEAIARQSLEQLKQECSSMTISTHLQPEFFFPTNKPSTTSSTELSYTFFRKKHCEPSGRLTFHLNNYARTPLESAKIRALDPHRADDYWAHHSINRVMSSIVALERDGKGRMASFYIVYVIEENFRNRRYDNINRLLKDIEISDLTEWSLIALLRSSFSARFNLPAWNALRDSTKKKLETEGKSARKLLRGLI